MLRCTSGLRHVLKAPSSTALPPCLCLRASQAPALHPLPPTYRPPTAHLPPTAHQSAASSSSSSSFPAEPSARHPGIARSAAQRTTPHSQPRHPRTARSLAAAYPDPAPFQALLVAGGTRRANLASSQTGQPLSTPSPTASCQHQRRAQDVGQLLSAPSVGPG